MKMFQSKAERERLLNLQRLEDKRLEFVEKCKKEGLQFSRALLVQCGGGFEGVGISDSGEHYVLTGPAPGDTEAEFAAVRIAKTPLLFEPHLIPGEGGGGVFGFGKKGGRGYKLVLQLEGGAVREILFIPALQCVYELKDGQAFGLLDSSRRRGEGNFVWDFQTIQPMDMDDIAARWS